MTNNLTGLTALIVAITGLITAIGTIIGIIRHIRGHNGKSSSPPQQPPPASPNDLSAENVPLSAASQSVRTRRAHGPHLFRPNRKT